METLPERVTTTARRRGAIEAYETGFIPVKINDYREALKFCQELIDTGLLPNQIKKPSQAVAIIMAGQELGMPPMRALRTIYIVEGRPTMKAEEMLAHFRTGGGRAREIESTKEACEWVFVHPNGDEHTERVTKEEVKAIAYTRDGKLKDNWAKNPGQRIMLRWRCIANGLRVAAPDVLGSVYTPEEMQDVVDQPETATADNVATLKDKIEAAQAHQATDPEPVSDEAEPDGVKPGAEKQEAEQEVEAVEVGEKGGPSETKKMRPTTDELKAKLDGEPDEPDVCVECGTEIDLKNIADDGLCLECATKGED